ncbi:serine/threonine-protein kinase [Sandaracinus amylolyticus]|uniref:serine/threonine-protein kinase n=1 Tax=Sandaracinus amylolyticus TaxID=927083 RepID=UPI001F20E511|nr:serine/threonine-protein kinase [Sandaracinus amylolyticus]UJR84981.1 Hypothetical protein I5071_70600 [Sandaracinus amylolyticus]
MDRERTSGAVSPSGPRRLGRYVLLGAVGRGGMGEVVRARAFGAGGATKDLCLKRIHADRLSRPGALERFVDEARLSLRLAHANIVAVFDFGRAGDEHYLAMEWVDGADLRSILGDASAQHEPLPPAVAAHVAAEVARALAYAHGLGVVHCDVKPANVLVARTGDVKLTDFGVATAIEAERSGGTRGYLPPERGVTPASDLWALGLVLGEMLLLDAMPERADEVAARAPEALAPILARLLDPDPTRRFHDASEVARELESYVARARASDGIAPRDVLASRADRVADSRHETRAEGTFEASASWARDGETAFTAPTVATASTRASDAPPDRRRARGIAALLGLVVIGAIAIASFARDTSPREGAPQPVVVAPPAPVTIAPAAPAAIEPAPEAPEPAPVEDTPPPRARTTRRDREPAPVPAVDAEPAHLRINAIPWAEVTLDGRSLGTTPLLDVSIAPGHHTLRFVNAPLGVERVREIDVAPGERRDLVIDLE